MNLFHILFRCCIVAAAVSLSLVLEPGRAAAISGISYVAPGGNCGGAGPCYSSVQAAVDAAAEGDEIRIAAGTYTGTNSNGGLSQMVYLVKSLTIKGGYTTSNWDTSDPDGNLTELQAQTLGRVVYVSGAATVVTLEGLHLTYGNSDGLGGHSPTSPVNYDAGGGIYVYQSNVALNHCWISNNTSPSNGYGGGLYSKSGLVQMTRTIMENNEAGHGGAAYLTSSQVQIGANSEFRNNRTTTANGEGAAIRAGGGTFTLSDSLIEDNTASANAPFAGALDISSDQFLVERTTIQTSLKTNGVALGGTGTLQDSTIQSNGYSGVRIGDGDIIVSGTEIASNGTGATYAEAGVQIVGNLEMDVNLADNYIHHNQNTYSGCNGGGVYIDTAATGWVTLTDNIIQENVAGKLPTDSHGYGGGVYIIGDNVRLERNVIQDNTAIGFIWASTYYYGGLGGGVYTNNSPMLINNLITGNSAKFKGSGVYIRGGSPNLYHTTVANNSAGEGNDQTGIYVAEKSSTEKAQPKIWNTVVANQTTGIYVKGDVTNNTALINSILWHDNTNNTGGTGTFFLSNELTGDPLFIDPASNDYHLGNGSAAIDAGLNGSVPAGVSTDLDGNARIANGIVDLGAYENQDRFLLTIHRAGGGTGSVTSEPSGIDCGSDCAQTYDASTTVTLTPAANPDSLFTGWSGDMDCADGQITMKADQTCIATFFKPVTLTITKAGTGHGTVTSTPAGINCGTDCTEIYDTGTAVALHANPNATSVFVGWSGVPDCSDGQLTMNTDESCAATFKLKQKMTLRSSGMYDGWVLESSEVSNKGGTMNSAGTLFSIGDDANDRQFRALLHFNSAGLPDTAVITKVTLKIKKQGLAGALPFTTHGNIAVDIRKGAFGGASGLQAIDFQAAANRNNVGVIKNIPLAGNWYQTNLFSPAWPFINRDGITQIRLRFAKDDNDDMNMDCLRFYSGNFTTSSYRPTLIIEYYLP
jgi:hypothetical protein